MGRFRDITSEDTGEGSIDISPLIDCVFILLIFFIVTTTFVEETGVEVDKPQAASSSNLEKTSIMIALTNNGEVMYGGKNIGVGAVRQTVRRELLKDKETPVIIEADTNANAGLLVRIIDEAKLAEARKVSIATRKNNG